MKRLLLLISFAILAGTSKAQNVYNILHEGALRTMKSLTSSYMQQQIAQFQLASLDYIKQKTSENILPHPNDLLDTQAYYMSEFLTYFTDKVLGNKRLKDDERKEEIARYTNISLTNPLFSDPNKVITNAHINNTPSFTPFSLDTDWEAAYHTAKGKENANAYLDEIRELREKVWRAWTDSVRSSEKQKLPLLFPLSNGMQSAALVIPDTLEPNAIMDYYWGFKTHKERSQNDIPTFVYLHGSGPRDAEWAAGLHWTCLFDDAPSNYFIPRIPNEGKYYRWWQVSKQWAWEWLWKQFVTTYGIDINRIIVFGISEGGYGSQRLASYYADYLAGAGPMAGGEPLINAPCENLQHIDFSLLTGEHDYMFCRNAYTQIAGIQLDSLQRLHRWSTHAGMDSIAHEETNAMGDYRHRVGLIKGAGHGFNYSPTTPWLRNARRNAIPKSFTWEDFPMDGKHRKGFYNIRVDKRPCDTLHTRYDVNINANGKIYIDIKNVHYIPMIKEPTWGLTLQWKKEYTPAHGGKLTLFLDERYIDLTKKVQIYVNGEKILTTKPKVHESAMKAALKTFADPERVFAAAISFEY